MTSTYNDPSPIFLTADAANISGSGQSMLGSATDWLTKGVLAAGVSGLDSIWNSTVVPVNNFLGGDMSKVRADYQLQDWGFEDTAAYYKQHQAGADLGGFILASTIPGTIGLKALKAMQGGALGTTAARSLGLAKNAQAGFLEAALADINLGVDAASSIVKANKYKAMVAGFGEQALQAAAMEVAIGTTMHSSPIFEEMDVGDMVINGLWGVALGGAIGGTFAGLGINRDIKKGIVGFNEKARPYESILDPGKQAVGLSGGKVVTITGGDRASAMLDHLDEMPLPAANQALSNKALDKYNNTWMQVTKLAIDMTPAEGELAKDAALANEFTGLLVRMKSSLPEEQFVALQKKDYMDLMLTGAAKLERAGLDSHVQPLEVSYLHPEGLKMGKQAWVTLKEVGDLKLNVDNLTKVHILKPAEEIKIARYSSMDAEFGAVTQFDNQTQAWNAGFDLYLDHTGKLIINPASSALQKVISPKANVSLYVNLANGEVTNAAYATAFDAFARTAEDVKVEGMGAQVLRLGSKRFDFTLATGFTPGELDTVTANARHLWADKLPLKKLLEPGVVINSNDTPVLERLLKEKLAAKEAGTAGEAILEKLDSISIQHFDGELSDLKHIRDLEGFIETAKSQHIKQLAEAGTVVDDIAVRLNAPKEAVVSGEGSLLQHSDMLYKPSTAKVTYEVTNPVLNPIDGMIMRGHAAVAEKIRLAEDYSKTVFANFAGELFEQFPDISVLESRLKANELPTGSTMLGSSNANYGEVKNAYQAIGASFQQLRNKRLDSTTSKFFASKNEILQDKEAAAELGIFMNELRNTGEKYGFLATENMDATVLTNLLNSAGVKLPQGGKQLILHRELINAIENDMEALAKGRNTSFTKDFIAGAKTAELKASYEVSPKVGSFLRVQTVINDERAGHFQAMYNAQGLESRHIPGTIYIPPINTERYSFFAFVRERSGGMGANSHVTVVTAKNAETLQAQLAKIDRSIYDVITKDGSKLYHEALGDYKYAMSVNESGVDSTLRKRGVLSDFFPATSPAAVLEDWADWHIKQETRLTRNYVELRYAQQFAELKAIGQDFTDIATSRFAATGAKYESTVDNPYMDHIKLALGIDKKNEQHYRLWQNANELVESAGNTAFNLARTAFGDAKKGLISWERANELAESMGIKPPFRGAAEDMIQAQILANTQYDRNVMSRFVNTANSVLAATVLRLDFINPLINIISTPILAGTELSSIRQQLKNNPEALGKLAEMMSQKVPGQELHIPSTMKLLQTAMTNYFGDSGEVLIARYKQAGYIKNIAQLHHEMLDDISDVWIKGQKLEIAEAKIKAAVDKGAKLTGNNFAEEFTRFVSADIMRQITEAAGLSVREQHAYISTFVNRVQGNYIANQRPQLFQGVLGKAIGLFQTYQFNLLQQVFRHVEAGDKKTLAIFGALQTSIFGLQGLPVFNAINTHLIGNAAGNPNHADLYTGTQQALGKEWGNWLMYGTASAFPLTPNWSLYTRGDLNPRTATILPLNPADWPIVAGSAKFFGNLANTFSKISAGGDVWTSLAQGIEHNGINRPMAGLGQWLASAKTGAVTATTSKGSLISANADILSMATASRLLGAKPLDEAVAMDAMYRSNAYRVKDLLRIGQLGEAIKTTLIGGAEPSQQQLEDFAVSYAASGGRITEFHSYLMGLTKGANTATVNSLLQKMNSPLGRNMQVIMGGEELPDYTNMQNVPGQ